jgi:hypothetical protein
MSMLFNHLLSAPLLYLDPGSGSFLIQLLLAAGLGMGVAIKMYWSKIVSLFKGKKSEPAVSTEEEDEE